MERACILAYWAILGVVWSTLGRKVKPAAETQKLAGKLARFPVWLAFVLLLVAGVFPEWLGLPGTPAWLRWCGVAIRAAGLALAIQARRTLGSNWSRNVERKQGHQLATTGPYGLVRHPIYSAHVVMALGSDAALCGFRKLWPHPFRRFWPVQTGRSVRQ